MNEKKQLALSLFLMRITVFVVMLVWTMDKLINPGHAATVYQKFYMLGGLSSTVMYTIGAIELVLLLAFVCGFKKKLTYGSVLVLHGISTLSSYKQYLAPFDGPNILFFAAWPMLAACITLFLLRDHDISYTIRI